MYSIDGLCPTGGMGGYGFSVHLSPEFQRSVSSSEINQEKADHVIKSYGEAWLHHCGWTNFFDPETCGFESDDRIVPSEGTRPSPSYREIRVSWGDWGPEHISVPGNACGLDIDDGMFCVFNKGKTLLPHNVDHWGQVNLLLIVFTWFAHSLTLLNEIKL